MRKGDLPRLRSGTTAERIGEALTDLALTVERHVAAAAERRGLTATQARILMILGAEGSMRASDLADRLGVGRPTISACLRVCIRKGLVTTHVNPSDARSSTVSLTHGGRYEVRAAAGWQDALLGAAGALSVAEQDAFLDGLVKVVAALQGAAAPPAAGSSSA